MGRRAKSVEWHVLQGGKNMTKGEVRDRKRAEAALQPASDNVVPPEWLGESASAEFRRIVSEWERAQAKVLTNLDVQALAIYCDALDKYIRASTVIGDDIVVTGSVGNKVKNPAIAAAKSFYDIVVGMGSRLGLDPSGRASLAIPRDQAEQIDLFDEEFGS